MFTTGSKLFFGATALSLAGAIVGLGVIVVGRKDWQYALPFGTFLAIGALAASLCGRPLVEWYLAFYR